MRINHVLRGKWAFLGGGGLHAEWYMCQEGKMGLPAGAYKRRNTVS